MTIFLSDTHIIFLFSLSFYLSIIFDKWKERTTRLSQKLFQKSCTNIITLLEKSMMISDHTFKNMSSLEDGNIPNNIEIFCSFKKHWNIFVECCCSHIHYFLEKHENDQKSSGFSSYKSMVVNYRWMCLVISMCF